MCIPTTSTRHIHNIILHSAGTRTRAYIHGGRRPSRARILYVGVRGDVWRRGFCGARVKGAHEDGSKSLNFVRVQHDMSKTVSPRLVWNSCTVRNTSFRAERVTTYRL